MSHKPVRTKVPPQKSRQMRKRSRSSGRIRSRDRYRRKKLSLPQPCLAKSTPTRLQSAPTLLELPRRRRRRSIPTLRRLHLQPAPPREPLTENFTQRAQKNGNAMQKREESATCTVPQLCDAVPKGIKKHVKRHPLIGLRSEWGFLPLTFRLRALRRHPQTRPMLQTSLASVTSAMPARKSRRPRRIAHARGFLVKRSRVERSCTACG